MNSLNLFGQIKNRKKNASVLVSKNQKNHQKKIDSMINIILIIYDIKLQIEKKIYVFSLEYLGDLILRPQNWSFLYVFDKVSIELLHIMHYSQRVMEIF